MVSEYLRSGRPAGRCCAPKFLYCTAVENRKIRLRVIKISSALPRRTRYARTADADSDAALRHASSPSRQWLVLFNACRGIPWHGGRRARSQKTWRGRRVWANN